MGRALQVLTGRVTNPGATITALTANTGDSFTVRSFEESNRCHLEQLWVSAATAGVARVRSPLLHDQAQGIRLRTLAGNQRPLLPFQADQRLYPQDALTVELSGGAAETDALTGLVYYEDLPGVNARLHTWEEIAPLVANIVTAEQNLTSGGTAAQYSASQAINANFDTLRRNVDYAVLGYVLDVACLTVGLAGTDTGNLRVGGPGVVAPDITAGWFVDLSRATGRPHIPVINAANVGSTTVDIAMVATATATNVSLILAQLARNLAT